MPGRHFNLTFSCLASDHVDTKAPGPFVRSPMDYAVKIDQYVSFVFKHGELPRKVTACIPHSYHFPHYVLPKMDKNCVRRSIFIETFLDIGPKLIKIKCTKYVRQITKKSNTLYPHTASNVLVKVC